MTKILFFISFLLSFNAFGLETFKANYKVFKSGKEIGKSTIELIQDGGSFLLIDETDGTHGMASFLGFKRSETTSFYEIDGNLNPHSYLMKQKVAFNKRESSYKIDFDSNTVSGNHKGTSWNINNFSENYSTPNLVKINLSLDICAGKTDNLNYKVLDAGKLKQYNFVIEKEENSVVEISKKHSKASRITKTWLDKNQHCLPVKTYHLEEGEEPIETQLIN
jgi:hypothetical protein